MIQSKYIKQKNFLTKKANLKELEYRNKLALKDPRTNTIEKWINKINDGRLLILPSLIKRGLRIKGNILELGAGMCWFSSELSKLKQVNQIYSLDFSKILLEKVAPHIMSYLNADIKKITRVLGDFNKLKFKKNTFDLVVFDAALHHVTNIPYILNEIKKVIKKNGRILAIREPILPKWRKGKRKKFGIKDKNYGITEQIFTLREWKNFFEKNSWTVRFFPYIPTNKFIPRLLLHKPFKFLNKFLFGYYIMLAKLK